MPSMHTRPQPVAFQFEMTADSRVANEACPGHLREEFKASLPIVMWVKPTPVRLSGKSVIACDHEYGFQPIDNAENRKSYASLKGITLPPKIRTGRLLCFCYGRIIE